LPILIKQCGGLLEALHDLLILRRYRVQRVFNEFEARQRAGGHGRIGIDDKGAGERRYRLKLLGHFFRAELNRLKLGIVGIAGEIVELVAQHVAAACKLILRHQGAIALELENFGENLAEGLEFPGKPGELFEGGRIGGALHRSVDGVLQAGFGCQRRLGGIFLAGHHVVLRQPPVGDQFAVYIAREVGFRDAVAIGGNTGRNPLESEIGEAHAGCRNDEHRGKAEHDFAAKSQGWTPGEARKGSQEGSQRGSRWRPEATEQSHLKTPSAF
jgi:hypothetical protein